MLAILFFIRKKLHTIFRSSERFKNTHTPSLLQPPINVLHVSVRLMIVLRAPHQPSQMNRDTFQWCARETDSVSERIIQLHTEVGCNTLYRHSSMFRSSQCYTHEAHVRVHVGNYVSYLFAEGHAVAPLVEALRYKPGSIPDGATGIFH